MSLTKKEKLVLFNQIKDIRLALEKIKPYNLPLRFGGLKELDDVIRNLNQEGTRK